LSTGISVKEVDLRLGNENVGAIQESPPQFFQYPQHHPPSMAGGKK
jgi:hypothetical protein